MKEQHILKMKCGVTVELTIDPTDGQIVCEWEPSPPYSEALATAVEAEYLPWRNHIIEQWAKKKGVKVAVVTLK